MNRKIIYYFVIPAAYLLIVISTFLISKSLFLPFKTHYHAGFVVFQDNRKLDFSDNKYMYIKPCLLNPNHNDAVEDKQLEKAHLHENVGDLVHVEESGAYWKDLFINIGYPVDDAKSTGYINGKQVFNFQMRPIHPYESLVVITGDNNPEFLKQAVTKDYILKMEKKSSACGD
ncbi:MAG: hypothetical protein UT84_C0001G0038 [Candidatus Curtissbacteria bacterium GW2011_GWA1_40_16]|uniref:Uncharacterized protein n=1 Tax=Candidatus Curtissbacteria bacterium GW2011_GWA1_40_16 TaxID=1618405 RepID=A0A0G0RFW5_9BACT|nr:MAG: hypothetical protein UT84_C0001G0038 [Candidatus Curtissbacteria bacterium GW2011_GWA1_40_16]